MTNKVTKGKSTKKRASKRTQELELEVINLDIDESEGTEEVAEISISDIPEVTVDEAELMANESQMVADESEMIAEPEINIESIPEVTVEETELKFDFVPRRAKKKAGLDKKFIGIIAAAVVLVVVIVGVVGFNIYESSVIYKVCRVEAGIEVTVEDFLKTPDENAAFTEDSDVIDPTVPGEYHLKIKKGAFTHACTLYIQDTTAPVVEVQPLVIRYGDTCTAMDFVKKLDEVTATTVEFATEPDFSKLDGQAVQIVVTDAGGNVVTLDTQLAVSPVVPSLSIEIGDDMPELSDFVLVDGEASFVVSGESEIDMTVPAVHKIIIEVNGSQYTSELHVLDTTPPVLAVEDVTWFTNVELDPGKFVTSCEDITTVQYTYETAPDYTLLGTQTVTIVATDGGGNASKQTANLTLEADTEAPKIKGARDKTVYVGEAVSYRSGVTTTDNTGVEATLSVDSSAVNVNEVGKYKVVYTATDAAGNSTSTTITLTVINRTYSLEDVNKLADDALATIIKDGMTNREKAEVIYKYIQSHVGYVSYSEKGDYIKAAYEGLATGKGDCYVYASVAKVMLTQAGLINMDIERIPEGDAMHYWNLVDLEDGHGWYHFDTTRRADGTKFCLWDDASIKEYSDAHNNSHNYDRSLYPDIP